MVRSLADIVSEYVRWHRNYFAGGPNGPRNVPRNRGDSGRTGGPNIDCEWFRTSSLGVAFGCNWSQDCVLDDVSDSSRRIFPAREGSAFRGAFCSGVHRPALLRRRLWDDAGICGRLLRRQADWLDLWVNAYSLGLCGHFRSDAYGAHAPGNRALQQRANVVGPVDASQLDSPPIAP